MTRVHAPRDTTYQQFKPATEKQIAFINRLQEERVIDSELMRISRDVWRAGSFTKEYASALIDEMMKSPKAKAARQPIVQAGIYENDGHLYRVYFGQQSGKMLVKSVELDEGVEYRYLGAAARVLPKDARRLTVEEVGSLGKAWDHCLCCGRRLDDPESVDRGIGPVCAKRY